MKNKKALLDKPDEFVVSSDLKKATKGDELTGMRLLSRLVDETLLLKLLERRRDIMREFTAYDFKKEEGLKQGLEQSP